MNPPRDLGTLQELAATVAALIELPGGHDYAISGDMNQAGGLFTDCAHEQNRALLCAPIDAGPYPIFGS